jgi:hypothetical protein
MPLLYPIAPNAREALDAEEGARTIAEARELARGPVALVTDWLRPEPAERETMQGKAEAGIARGFVQIYEDAKGRPVIAVTFWKPGGVVQAPVRSVKAPAKEPAPAEDHTDDLYFAKPSAKVKRKKKAADPDQLDLFGAGKARSEDADAHGPGVVIVEEDSDN